MTSKLLTVRKALFVLLFVLLVMAVYFAILPADQSHSLLASSHTSSSRSVSGVHNGVLVNVKDSWVSAAKAIVKDSGAVYTTMINDAYFDFAASWMCNTKLFSNVHHRVLYLTTDNMTAQRLRLLFPEVSVVAMDGAQFSGNQEYSRAGYVRMMVERTEFILTLLEAHIPVLLFEVDCVWFRDPLPLLMSQQYSSMDIVATKVSGQNVVAGGFLLLRPTEATLSLWQKLTHMMSQLHSQILTADPFAPVSESQNDQQFFSQLVTKQYANIKIGFLPEDMFPDGKWYTMSYSQQKNQPIPYIINNNWVLGNSAKIERAKKFGHWFWDERNSTCNNTAVFHLVGHGQ